MSEPAATTRVLSRAELTADIESVLTAHPGLREYYAGRKALSDCPCCDCVVIADDLGWDAANAWGAVASLAWMMGEEAGRRPEEDK